MNEELNRRRAFVAALAAGVVLAAPAAASETVTYNYDALGRLLGAAHVDGPNDGAGSAYAYDPAGNRTQATAGTGVTPPTPPPGNLAPVTVADSASVETCEQVLVNVVANDSDPEGGSVTLVGVTEGGKGEANDAGDTSVHYWAGPDLGQDVLTYTVEDNLGAQETGTLTMTVTLGPDQSCGF